MASGVFRRNERDDNDDNDWAARHDLPCLQRPGVRPVRVLGRVRLQGYDRGAARSAGSILRGLRRRHLRQLFCD